jgi:branched-chain amino acid transport system permease protein
VLVPIGSRRPGPAIAAEFRKEIPVTDALQVTIGGLATGSLYALLLFGVLLIFRVSKAVNFAYGQIGMFAAFFAYFLYSRDVLSIALAVAVGLLSAVALSYLTDRMLLERLPSGGTANGQDLVITLGVMLLLTAVAQQYFGNNTYSFLTLGNDTQFSVGGIFFNLNQISVAVLTAAMFGGFAWLLLRTQPGVTMRASAADADLASSFGLNVRRIRGVTWSFAGLVAGLAGIVVASRLSVDAFYMTPFLIKAFVAGIIGGLDRFVTPLLIAFALGVYEAWATHVLGTNYGTPAVFLLVIVLLAVLPKSFLDERQEARA